MQRITVPAGPAPAPDAVRPGDTSPDAMRSAVDLWPAAVILLAADGAVVECNRAATALLARGPVVMLEAGKLRFRRQEDSATFRLGVERAASERATQYLCLQGRQGNPTLGLTVMPQGVAGLLVIACELIDDLAPDPVPLSKMLGVTPAEGRVAVALASGLGIAAIAERDRLSVHTVRDHVKHVLAKTGANSQAQLVRLVVKLAQIAAVPAGPGPTAGR